MARWVLAALLVLGTVVMALSHDGNRAPVADLHADAPYYYIYLPSLMHGDLDFSDEYKETKNWYHLKQNVFGIGPAVFDAPLFVVAHGAALVTGSRDDGFSKWEVWSYSWTSLLYSLGAVLVAGRLVRRRGLGFRSGLSGMVGPLVAALAGPVVYYAVRQPGYAHPVATFWADAARRALGRELRRARTWKTWLVLGGVLGAAMLARPQLALWGLLLGAAAIDDLRKSPRTIVNHLLGLAAMVVAFSPQLLAWHAMYGQWWVVPQGPGFMRWDQPCWSEALFSSRNGLFPWSPAYFVFLIALVGAARKLPRLVIALVAGLVLQAIANGAAWDWWAGGSFGGRRFDSCYIVFAVGAAWLVEWGLRPRALPRRIAAWCVLALAGCIVIANLWLAGYYTATNARILGADPASRVIPLKGRRRSERSPGGCRRSRTCRCARCSRGSTTCRSPPTTSSSVRTCSARPIRASTRTAIRRARRSRGARSRPRGCCGCSSGSIAAAASTSRCRPASRRRGTATRSPGTPRI